MSRRVPGGHQHAGERAGARAHAPSPPYDHHPALAAQPLAGAGEAQPHDELRHHAAHPAALGRPRYRRATAPLLEPGPARPAPALPQPDGARAVTAHRRAQLLAVEAGARHAVHHACGGADARRAAGGGPGRRHEPVPPGVATGHAVALGARSRGPAAVGALHRAVARPRRLARRPAPHQGRQARIPAREEVEAYEVHAAARHPRGDRRGRSGRCPG